MKSLFLLLFIFLAFSTFGQVVEDDTIYKEVDSLIIGNGKELEKDMVEFSKKDNVFSKLLRNIIRKEGSSESNGWDYSHSDYEKYSGKAIKEIVIVNLNVFGSEEDKDKKDLNFIARAANSLHIPTRAWIIRNQLLFKEGETLSPFIVSESERLLRNKPYLYTAEITVFEDEMHSDSVSVQVRVRDVWSILPDGRFSMSNRRGYLRFEDINFLGYGLTFFGAVKKNYTYNRKWSIDGGLRFDNLFQQHLDATIFRESDGWGRTYGISLNREFVSPVFNWAGGVHFSWSDNYFREITNDTIQIVNENLQIQEYWLGYATDFSRFTKILQLQNEFYVAARYKRTHLTTPPEVIHEYYGSNQLSLFSLGYAFRRYHQTRYVRYLGRVEDIPVGSIVSFTGGTRDGIYGTRLYGGFMVGHSFYRRKVGYLSGLLEAGSYFKDGVSELGSINAQIFYFTPYSRMGSVGVRHFISLKGGFLHNPFLFDHLANLEQNRDIRGFPDAQTGNKRFTVNYEFNLYPPIKILGFNFALIGFADLSWLVSDHNSTWERGFYQGFGGGIRIRNEMLVFRSVQVLFGFYPTGADRRFHFFEQPTRFYDMNFIEFSRPRAVIE